jgi:tetratricopeptide (TPR) repeat protein
MSATKPEGDKNLMVFRNWIKNFWKTLKYVYGKVGGKETKRITTLLVMIIIIYYAIEGFGRTIIAEFRIPQDLQKDLVGVDNNTLTHQLIVELQNIRAIQETARNIKFNLVKGHESLDLREGPFEISLLATVYADYEELIENIGMLEWGPLRIPAGLLLRPFQKLIQQKFMHLSLQRMGNSYRISAITDRGEVWEITEEELVKVNINGNSLLDKLDKLSNLIRGLAYKIAFLDGIEYKPLEIWVGSYHFHQGIRHVADYYGKRESVTRDTFDILDRASKEFASAIDFNPADKRSHYNLILMDLEKAFYLENGGEKIESYEKSLEKIKKLNQKGAFFQTSLRNLFIANYILLAATYFTERQYPEAIQAYQTALKLPNGNPNLRAYISNNIGITYQKLREFEGAEDYFRKSMEYNPSYPRAYLNLGNLLQKNGDFASAEKAYWTVIEKHPDYLSAFYNLGTLYFNFEHGDKAAFDQLDEETRSCLREQALFYLKKYLSILEDEAITRNLSEEERESLDVARDHLKYIEITSGSTEAKEGFVPSGNCLEQGLKGK